MKNWLYQAYVENPLILDMLLCMYCSLIHTTCVWMFLTVDSYIACFLAEVFPLCNTTLDVLL